MSYNLLNSSRLLLMLMLLFPLSPAEGQFIAQRGTVLKYSVQKADTSYRIGVNVKVMMPYRGFTFSSAESPGIEGEYNIANPAVKGTTRLILELQGGTNNTVEGMPFWLSMLCIKQLTDSGSTFLSVNGSPQSLFKIAGRKKVRIPSGKKKLSLNLMILKEFDPVTGKFGKGKELHVINDPVNPLVTYYKGDFLLKLTEVIEKKAEK